MTDLETKLKAVCEERTTLQQEKVVTERDVKQLKQAVNILQRAQQKADTAGDKKHELLEKEVR